MDDQAPPFAVDSAVPKNHDAAGGDVISPKTPPGEKLSGDEKKVWEYICAQLQAAGLDHITSGLAIRIVVKTYIRWLQAEKRLDEIEEENNGTYIIQTPNGHWQPHQAFYVTKSLKTELLKWLPECCLTIPSVATTKQKLGSKPPIDDLFESMQNHAAQHPSAGRNLH